MLLNSALFYFFAAIVIASSILAISRREILQCCIFLATTLIATGGIFLQLQAEFIFAAQLLACGGGIVVLFIFAALLWREKDSSPAVRTRLKPSIGIILGVILATQVTLAALVAHKSLQTRPRFILPASDTDALAEALFRHHLLPFEMVSVLFVIALLGGVAAASRGAD